MLNSLTRKAEVYLSEQDVSEKPVRELAFTLRAHAFTKKTNVIYTQFDQETLMSKRILSRLQRESREFLQEVGISKGEVVPTFLEIYAKTNKSDSVSKLFANLDKDYTYDGSLVFNWLGVHLLELIAEMHKEAEWLSQLLATKFKGRVIDDDPLFKELTSALGALSGFVQSLLKSTMNGDNPATQAKVLKRVLDGMDAYLKAHRKIGKTYYVKLSNKLSALQDAYSVVAPLVDWMPHAAVEADREMHSAKSEARTAFTWDDFDDDDKTTAPSEPNVLAQLDLKLKENASMHNPDSILKGGTPSTWVESVFYYYTKSRAWAFKAKASTSAEAAKIGKKAQSLLKPTSTISAATPGVHTRTLYVMFGDEWVEVPGLAETVKKTDISDLKHKITIRAQNFFGTKGATLAGSQEKGYTLVITPYLKTMRGKIPSGTLKAATLEEMLTKLMALLKDAAARLGIEDDEE